MNMLSRKIVNNLEPQFREAYIALVHSLRELQSELSKKEKERKVLTKTIDAEISDIQNKIIKANAIISSFLPKEETAYDSNAGWKQKILWVLKNQNTLLPVAEISKIINDKEPNLDIDVIPTIRLTCKRMVEKNELKEHSSPNVKGQHFGLNEWFDNNGDLVEPYYL